MGKATWHIEGNFWDPPDTFVEGRTMRTIYSELEGKYIRIPEPWRPSEYELRRYPLETYLRQLEMRSAQYRWIKAMEEFNASELRCR